MNNFLDLIGVQLNKERAHLPDTVNYTLRFRQNERSFASLWFRTRGCRYSYLGGCTMCDYFTSDSVSPGLMVDYVKQALEELKCEPDMLVMMNSGSFFDDWEVPQVARREIYKELSRFKKTIFVFETHVNTINDEVLGECLSFFEASRVNVEIGVESTNYWIRKYCINKKLSHEQIITTLETLKKFNINSTVNIMVGIPFLTTCEAIQDAINSIHWAFANGVGQCVIFPINIKPWTLVHWLEKENFYEQPSLWAYIEVLSRVNPEFIPRVEIAWYRKSPPLQHPLYKDLIRGPQTCPKCNDMVVELLDRYFLGDIERMKIINELKTISCECRDNFYKQIERMPECTLEERVKMIYEKMGVGILGEEWWQEYGQSVLNSVPSL